MSVGLRMLNEDVVKVWGRIPSTREALVRVRLRALRSRVWYKALSSDERVFVELVIRVTDRVRSFLLAKLLSRIMKKLLEAMGGFQALIGRVACEMKTNGLLLAQKQSRIAQGWGNKSAAKWPEDPGFVQYLTIMCLNKPS